MFYGPLGFAAWLCQECSMVNFLRPRVAEKTLTRGSHILTMQKYHISVAVYEYFTW